MEIKYERETSKTFEEACESLKINLSDSGFGVLWELNFKDKLQEKGLDFTTNFKIFEVCNPKQAKEILDYNIEIGYFLPCKMVAYEKDSKVYLGMLRPEELIKLSGAKDAEEVAKSVERTLKYAIDKSV